MAFSTTLSSLRRTRRLSQLALSKETGVSQRHISFLESGRAKPGADVVRKLASGLNLSFVETNELYESAGLVPPRAEFSMEDSAFAPAQRAMQTLLENHMPNPAIAVARSGEILFENDAFARTKLWAFSEDPKSPIDPALASNLYDLTLHPDGLRRFMLNPEEIIPHTLRRLRSAARFDEETRRVLERCKRYAGLSTFKDLQEPRAANLSSVLVENYRVHSLDLSFVSMVAAFGSPEDVTAQNIQLELFFPNNRATTKSMSKVMGHDIQ
ncbi:MAG: helix-turn-helix domain-containing protein [Pseudomonadota bacterium]